MQVPRAALKNLIVEIGFKNSDALGGIAPATGASPSR